MPLNKLALNCNHYYFWMPEIMLFLNKVINLNFLDEMIHGKLANCESSIHLCYENNIAKDKETVLRIF